VTARYSRIESNQFEQLALLGTQQHTANQLEGQEDFGHPIGADLRLKNAKIRGFAIPKWQQASEISHPLTRTQSMKTAQEIRVGNVIMHGKDPMVVLRTEYSRGGRGSSTVRMKLKSLIANFGTEVVFQCRRQNGPSHLGQKECTYSYFADPMYVCMDSEYNQYEVEARQHGRRLELP
jgi:translation elongation factor P/translation initiation factor 5A